jgi:TolB-like protein
VKEFFQELQSKRIYRVAGAYIVSAWVILQVAAIVFPSLELPSWSMKVVLDMVLLGFVPALLLGWHLDLRRARAERSSVLKKDVARDPQSPSERSLLGEGSAGLDAKPPAMQTAPRGETPDTRRGLAALSAGVAALLILAAAGGWYLLGGRQIKPAQTAHLSVVVLPFTNLSGDPSQDYFADGITENLTTDLSRIRNSFVIARNTAFTYKGEAIDAKAIGKELGVRYLLEGSVQRDQNRVRVNAQLIDAESGAHIWADRFEADMADLFKLQDQVVAQLANALRYELGMAEAAKASSVQNPDAIDLAMRGWAFLPRSLPNKDQVDAFEATVRAGAQDRPRQQRGAGGESPNDLLRVSLCAEGGHRL